MIYLDNAGTSWPKPESVYQTMDRFLREKGGNPGRGGHSMAVAAGEVIEETRMLVARFINAPDIKRITFTLNCTVALNLALKGLAENARTIGEYYPAGMDLAHGGGGQTGPVPGVARAKSVHQVLNSGQGLGTQYTLGIRKKH